MLSSNAESDTLTNRLYLTLHIGEEQFEKYTFFQSCKGWKAKWKPVKAAKGFLTYTSLFSNLG